MTDVEAALRSLLDEVETLCDDNGQNAIRVDDLASLIRDRIAALSSPETTPAPDAGLRAALVELVAASDSIPQGATSTEWVRFQSALLGARAALAALPQPLAGPGDPPPGHPDSWPGGTMHMPPRRNRGEP